MVGFDIYDSNPSAGEDYRFPENFKRTVELTDNFAKLHGKLFAVTETGISTEAGALLPAGNPRPDWYTEILNALTRPEIDCCYFMLWSNYSREKSYYTPFVESINADGTLYGHEMLDGMLRFYQDRRSIFAADQYSCIAQIRQGVVPQPERISPAIPDGYIVCPVSGKRVLEPTTLEARLNSLAAGAEFRIAANKREWTVPTVMEGRLARGMVSEALLQEIGVVPDGKIRLYILGNLVQEISVLLNVEEAPKDPYLVDDFESYAGLSELLNRSWAVNKDGECDLTLTPSEEYSGNGRYSLKFAYRETKNRWAGCEFKKETDWSSCNALQFWVVPDGKNQKTVVQINTADGGSYEAYLQDYPEYAQAAQPLLVTLPFSEFTDKNEGGKLTSEAAAKVTGMGLWVNAISDSPAIDAEGMVSGVLYYDHITAVSGDFTQPVFSSAAK